MLLSLRIRPEEIYKKNAGARVVPERLDFQACPLKASLVKKQNVNVFHITRLNVEEATLQMYSDDCVVYLHRALGSNCTDNCHAIRIGSQRAFLRTWKASCAWRPYKCWSWCRLNVAWTEIWFIQNAHYQFDSIQRPHLLLYQYKHNRIPKRLCKCRRMVKPLFCVMILYNDRWNVVGSITSKDIWYVSVQILST